MTVIQMIRDIKEMKVHGAREIAKTGVLCLKLAAEKSKAKNKRDFGRDMQDVTDKLIKARPTEPMLRNSVKIIMMKVHEHDFENIKQFTSRICDNYLLEMKLLLEKIAKEGANQITDGDIILTHCHSHDVIEVMKIAKKEGRKFEAVVTETEPRGQGIDTARDLLKAGIPVTFCVDSAIAHVMGSVDKVMMGCDAILPDGSIVNKIGTFPIAIVAMQFARPVYILGETLKYTKRVEIEERNPREVIDPKKIKGAKIINPAFDITPAEYIHVIITEKGMMSPDAVKDLLSGSGEM
jgi:ribose 1,5-bisphosphate isomerase